jgi:ketopantoate hydroxymethyltransferase
MTLNKEQLAILNHVETRAARNLYCGDSPDMQVLVAAGMMKSAGRIPICPDEYFRITDKGREALRLYHREVGHTNYDT